MDIISKIKDAIRQNLRSQKICFDDDDFLITKFDKYFIVKIKTYFEGNKKSIFDETMKYNAIYSLNGIELLPIWGKNTPLPIDGENFLIHMGSRDNYQHFRVVEEVGIAKLLFGEKFQRFVKQLNDSRAIVFDKDHYLYNLNEGIMMTSGFYCIEYQIDDINLLDYNRLLVKDRIMGSSFSYILIDLEGLTCSSPFDDEENVSKGGLEANLKRILNTTPPATSNPLPFPTTVLDSSALATNSEGKILQFSDPKNPKYRFY